MMLQHTDNDRSAFVALNGQRGHCFFINCERSAEFLQLSQMKQKIN